MKRLFAALLCVLTGTAAAHHSFAAFDQTKVVEIEGELTDVTWVNPHVRFKVRGKDATGAVRTWDVEGHSVSVLRRSDVDREDLKIGEHVKLAVNLTREPSDHVFVLNLLTASNRELVLQPGTKPRWATAKASGANSTWFTAGSKVAVKSQGLFRVWSSVLNDPHANPYFWPKTYPLTEKARSGFAKWNPVKDSTLVGCQPKGMPFIMEQPYPMMFVDQGKTILLRMEEYDTVRTIYMGAAPNPAPPASPLGNSVGRWQGNTLVVTTSGINWPYFDASGVRQSTAIRFTEEFTPSADGSRLEYKAVATDPATFTEPVKLERHWVWRPEEQVKPYDCKA
jgi:hypothetical protein